jgi:hypothetical protein
VEKWEQYQHRAAELLRELGFTAEVDARLTEANGAVHAIDVAARRAVAGVDVLWIVECKYRGRPVSMGMARELRSLVFDLGADRGLLMSESGFQSGAIRTARQKNITLTSLADLRADAADEILAARVTAAEKRLMDLALRVNRDLRPFAVQTPRMLAAFAAGFPPEAAEEFATRPEAIDFVEGIGEVLRRVEGLTPEDHLAFMAHPGELAMPWRPEVDQNVMDGAAAAIHYTTQALYQGRLDQWPAMCPAPGAIKLSWSMAQLIDVVESMLPDLERKAAEQEAGAAGTPRLPWFDIIKPGTMPLPRDTWGQDLRK